jgi:hypothetical protein
MKVELKTDYSTADSDGVRIMMPHDATCGILVKITLDSTEALKASVFSVGP